MNQELVDAYKSGNLILFAGAGVSMNLGLPSWNQLVDQLAQELGYDPAVFRTFGDNLALTEFYRIQKGSIGSLRSWMDREWHKDSVEVGSSRIHLAIAAGNFPLIYTTNYDRWLERAHDHYQKKYVRIVSVADIKKIDPRKTQIVKLHGDFDDDSTIVLDETSYFRRLDFSSPLDIKLRSDVLGRSVLFIGYSLNDINIRYLFHKLATLWEGRKPDAQARSFIFSPRPNPVQREILKQWGIEMITSEEDNQGLALSQFMENLIAQ